jgi:hypothetical protein
LGPNHKAILSALTQLAGHIKTRTEITGDLIEQCSMAAVKATNDAKDERGAAKYP